MFRIRHRDTMIMLSVLIALVSVPTFATSAMAAPADDPIPVEQLDDLHPVDGPQPVYVDELAVVDRDELGLVLTHRGGSAARPAPTALTEERGEERSEKSE